MSSSPPAAGERLDGKVVLITGGSSGIGAAAARRFAGRGARVAVIARRADVLAGLAAEIGALAIAADVSDGPQIAAAVAAAAGTLGDPDIVVNSAGMCAPASLAETSDDSWRRHIDVNLSGSFYVARETGVRMMAGSGGTIINVGSELSVMGMAGYVAYCASKAGVIGLTRALAAELAPKVTVNAICPGPVDTPMLRAEFEHFSDGDDDRDRVAAQALQRVPLRRFATADEVAAGIYYLAVDAPYATGTTLELDGGTTAV